MNKNQTKNSTQTGRESQTQKRGECERKCAESSGPSQRSISSENPCMLEADPKHTGEEPGRTPDATWSGTQRGWVSDVVVENRAPALAVLLLLLCCGVVALW